MIKGAVSRVVQRETAQNAFTGSSDKLNRVFRDIPAQNVTES
jgi:hypothetical protein